MKRVLKYVFLFIMIIPILVKASSFSDAKEISNNYQSKFLTPDRYLVSSTTTWGLDGTGTCTMTGCSCSNGWSVWKNNCGISQWYNNSRGYVYGSCSESGGGSTQTWRYLCEDKTTVYYPN